MPRWLRALCRWLRPCVPPDEGMTPMFHPPLPSGDRFPEVPEDGHHCAGTPWNLCADAKWAYLTTVLIYDTGRKAWVMPELPRRRMDVKRARYFANYAGPDTTGEPFLFTSCPYCGGTLPTPREEPQADGS